jgi:hypothetical protein
MGENPSFYRISQNNHIFCKIWGHSGVLTEIRGNLVKSGIQDSKSDCQLAETRLGESPKTRILEAFPDSRATRILEHGGDKNHLTIWKMIVRIYEITEQVIHVFECPFLKKLFLGSPSPTTPAAPPPRHDHAAAAQP